MKVSTITRMSSADKSGTKLLQAHVQFTILDGEWLLTLLSALLALIAGYSATHRAPGLVYQNGRQPNDLLKLFFFL